MKEIILDGNILSEKETAHDYVKQMLELPEYYGNNLDALYDCLTELQDVVIKVRATKQENIYFQRMIGVLEAAAEDNEGMEVHIEF